jgi:Mor family transcriptional regulator
MSVRLTLRRSKRVPNGSPYKLSDGSRKRHQAIDKKINHDTKRMGSRKAALAKKRRLGVLRIYRKYRRPKECKILTKDMKYIDKKYLQTGKTSNQVCIS